MPRLDIDVRSGCPSSTTTRQSRFRLSSTMQDLESGHLRRRTGPRAPGRLPVPAGRAPPSPRSCEHVTLCPHPEHRPRSSPQGAFVVHDQDQDRCLPRPPAATKEIREAGHQVHGRYPARLECSSHRYAPATAGRGCASQHSLRQRAVTVVLVHRTTSQYTLYRGWQQHLSSYSGATIVRIYPASFLKRRRTQGSYWRYHACIVEGADDSTARYHACMTGRTGGCDTRARFTLTAGYWRDLVSRTPVTYRASAVVELHQRRVKPRIADADLRHSSGTAAAIRRVKWLVACC